MPNSCCCGSIISFASTLEQSRKGKPEIRASSKLSNSNNNNHKYNYCHCHCHYPTIIGYRPETKGHKELLETRLQLAHMAKNASTAQATYTVDPSGYNLKKAQRLWNGGTQQNHGSFVNALSSWLARARKSTASPAPAEDSSRGRYEIKKQWDIFIWNIRLASSSPL